MPINSRASDILDYWLGDSNLGPEQFRLQSKRWYAATPEIDQEIHDRFGDDLKAAERGECDHWAASATGMLALVVLLDQFSRNLYRGKPEAFSNDAKAQRLLSEFVDAGKDAALTIPERLLLYHPLLHAEDPSLQHQIVALHETMLEECNEAWRPIVENTPRYSREHADVIERFGRFPHRNAILGRESTPEELEFLAGDSRSYGQGTDQQRAKRHSHQAGKEE